MSSDEQDPADLESVPYQLIKFTVKRANGTSVVHEADCCLSTVILGLKEDMSPEFEDPKNQRWEYKNIVLEDDKTLRDYGIDGTGDKPTIVVQISRH